MAVARKESISADLAIQSLIAYMSYYILLKDYYAAVCGALTAWRLWPQQAHSWNTANEVQTMHVVLYHGISHTICIWEIMSSVFKMQSHHAELVPL